LERKTTSRRAGLSAIVEFLLLIPYVRLKINVLTLSDHIWYDSTCGGVA